LETKDGGKQKVYEAKILKKPWLNFKKVQNFKLISENNEAPSVSPSYFVFLFLFNLKIIINVRDI
jgi:hypothetical protein